MNILAKIFAERRNMKNGSLLKNITDSFLIIALAAALIFLAVSFVGFEKEGYVIEHPRTEKEIEVKGFLDDPYNTVYILMAAGFLVSAVVGFSGRKRPLGSLLWSIFWMAVVLFEYGSGLLGQIDYTYILCGGIGLIGNIVFYACCTLEKGQSGEEIENTP